MEQKYKKAYILYANESYFDIVSTCVKSIREFSKLPIIVYLLNSDLKIDIENVKTINWECDLDKNYDGMYLPSTDNFYIDRDSDKIYRLLIQRPRITKDALEKYAEVVAYVDSDTVATFLVDTIFDFYDPNTPHPYFVEGIYDWLIKDGRGGAKDYTDLSTTLEHPACVLFGVNQYVRQRYRTSNIFVAGQNTLDFIEEWYWMCINPKVFKNFSWYAPFHEETLANVLLWKYKYLNGLPYLYVNGTSSTIDTVYNEIDFNNNKEHYGEWFRVPAIKEHVLFFHGEKRIDVMNEMIEKIKSYHKPKVKSGLYYKDIKIADAGYVINLPERTDRKENVIAVLDSLHITGYEFVDGVVITDPELSKLGCTQTYLNIFEKVLNSDIQNILVFEDDIKLMNGVTEEHLDKIFNNWDSISNEYDVTALGVKLLPRSKIIRKDETHGSFKEMLCSQSLYYKKPFIEHCYNYLKNYTDKDHELYKCTIDMFLNDSSNSQYRFIHSPLHKEFNFGITIPMVFTQTSSFSDNEKVNQDYDKIMESSYWESMLYEKAYILYGNEQYYDILETTIKSIREFSDLPIIVYLLNSEKRFYIKNVTTVKWACQIRNETNNPFYENNNSENLYIDRNKVSVYDTLIQRPMITKHAIQNFSKVVCYVDGDSVALPTIDNIFNYYPIETSYPYFTDSVYDWMIWDGRGGASGSGDLTTTLEYPACELFGVDQSFRLKTNYKQTGYYVAGQNTIEFLDEWYSMCINPIIMNRFGHYAAYHEETIVNVLLWKKEITNGLHNVYVNGTLETVDLIYNKITYNGHKQNIKEWTTVPGCLDMIFFLHGEKRKEVVKQMIREIKKQKNMGEGKIKLLFLAPHLSTGGMPAFLLKRIELLKQYAPNIELFVVEYSDFSPVYVVQKNRIKELIDSDHFWTLGEDKLELIEIIKSNGIDVVHVEEMLEGFETYNQVSLTLLNELYSNDRTWKIVETCHNISFNPEVSKKYNPEAYAFCTPWHKETTFSKMPSYGEVLEYPIDNKSVSVSERFAARERLGLSEDKIHVLNVGLWTPGKNQKEGVEVAKLMGPNSSFEFHFVGNQAPNFREYWEPIMSDLPANVRVWGERDDVEDFMRAADIFMFNSTWECNPLVLRDAVSHGLKILSRNLPQYMDMFTPYITEIQHKSSPEFILQDLYWLLDEEKTYEIPENQSEDFALKSINLYENVSLLKIKPQNKITSNISFVQYFVNNPHFEILGEGSDVYNVKFFDETGFCHYQSNLKPNNWSKLNREYFTNWTTKVWNKDVLVYENTLDYEGKKVFIAFDSKSLGDSVAWIPYCLEFKKKHKCTVIVSTFWNKLFKKVYPELEFVEPGSVVHGLHGMYTLGWFYNKDKEPELPNTIPLQKTATNILGLDYTEIKPNIYHRIDVKPYYGKYVVIATNSTAGCKFWTKEAWQKLINYLIEKGYKVINVSKEDNPFDGVLKIRDTSIEHTMNVIHHSEFFIGLSSGLSWLAWALGKHVVMISNFTTPDHEFTSNCTRIINLDVCNGCWNNPLFRFNAGDWDWCPVNKGTPKQFECHKSITSDMVIKQIQHLIT